MNDESGFWVVAVGVVAALGAFFLGAAVSISHFDFNTRDCTITCPGNAESIEWKGACYCKLEGK